MYCYPRWVGDAESIRDGELRFLPDLWLVLFGLLLFVVASAVRFES